MPRQIRKAVGCPILGAPSELPQFQLPTEADVLKYYKFVRLQLKSAIEPPISDIASAVAKELLLVWSRASIPVCTDQWVESKVVKIYKEYRDKIKKMNPLQANEKSIKSNSHRKVYTENLFDIAACKCDLLNSCKCQKSKRVPQIEKEFLIDQRGPRIMYIDRVDEEITQQNVRRELRRQKEEERQRNYELSQQASILAQIHEKMDDFESETETEQTSDESTDDFSYYLKQTKSKDIDLTLFVIELDRTGISDRAGARICNSLLTSLGIIDKENKTAVVDRNKIRRARERIRNVLKAKNLETKLQPQCLYFDGKKDTTKIQVQKEGKLHHETVTEDHYCICAPDGEFVGHITAPNSKDMPGVKAAERILVEMLNYFHENEIDLKFLRALGCDGTALNTGVDFGILRRMEIHLGWPLQHIICLLHTNELPLRHLFHLMDGETTGPKTFSGPIGKMLLDCEINPAVPFDLIVNNNFPVLEERVAQELSRDQQYLYNICNVVMGRPNGNIVQAIGHKIGPLNHSRWLTRASRILRLYISVERKNESYENLKTLAEFVIRSYAQIWFEIKCNPYIVDAARHFFQMVKTTRYLPEKLRLKVDQVLTTNFSAGHSESVLLTMLADPLKKVQAINLIKQIRCISQNRFVEYQSSSKSQFPQISIRKFTAPKFRFYMVNENTKDDQYDLLLDLTRVEDLMEPPLTIGIEECQLNNFEVPKFPCHTQQTERIIRLVSKASQLVVGENNREGIIVNTMYSRSITGKFDSKKDYIPMDIDELTEVSNKFQKKK